MQNEKLIAHIQAAPDGPQVAALFDFDGTIMAGFSAVEFTKAQIKARQIGRKELLEMVATIGQFSVGKIGFSGMMAAGTKVLEGVSEAEYARFGEGVYEKQIAAQIYPEARALIRAHLRKGHTVAIVSSATPYQIEPAARDLDIDRILCSRMEVVDGKFTGEIIRPLCFGEGKVHYAEEIAAEVGADLDKSFFYSDSDDDLLLLERIGHPRVLNPNKKLAAIAQERGWPVERFTSRDRLGLSQVVRSLAADLSMIPSLVAALPIWALGSKREAQNFAASIYTHVSSTLIGLKLDVKGEHHLWEKRPAIFVFNHQSKADSVIMPMLLRENVAGVGKKEIAPIPLFAKMMELGGVVLIDRKNSASAIEAMQPLVDRITQEGVSVMMAPEGTRTVSPKLKPFKKGAFHLAIQAGVPIVPVVIHNAMDAAPKGAIIYRPTTVHVEVLPPVDTGQWSTDTIDDHVAEVRGMFLKALDQTEAKAAGAVATPTPAGRRPARRRKASTKKAVARKNAGRKKVSRKSAGKKAAGKKAASKKAASRKKAAAGKARPTKKSSARPPRKKKTLRKARASSSR